jgi:hypothetical protein
MKMLLRLGEIKIKPAKLVALRKALTDLDIEYAVDKRDKNLVSLNIRINKSQV